MKLPKPTLGTLSDRSPTHTVLCIYGYSGNASFWFFCPKLASDYIIWFTLQIDFWHYKVNNIESYLLNIYNKKPPISALHNLFSSASNSLFKNALSIFGDLKILRIYISMASVHYDSQHLARKTRLNQDLCHTIPYVLCLIRWKFIRKTAVYMIPVGKDIMLLTLQKVKP